MDLTSRAMSTEDFCTELGISVTDFSSSYIKSIKQRCITYTQGYLTSQRLDIRKTERRLILTLQYQLQSKICLIG